MTQTFECGDRVRLKVPPELPRMSDLPQRLGLSSGRPRISELPPAPRVMSVILTETRGTMETAVLCGWIDVEYNESAGTYLPVWKCGLFDIVELERA